MKNLPIKTKIKYNEDIYEITGSDNYGYNIKIINPLNDVYASYISYNTTFEIIQDNIKEKELDLREFFKGYENKEFYCPIWGKTTILSTKDKILITPKEKEKRNVGYLCLDYNGKIDDNSDVLFYPSFELYNKYPKDAYSAWKEWRESKKSACKTRVKVEFFEQNHMIDDITFEMEVSDSFDINTASTEIKEYLQKYHKK